jgi:hypothetical protein
MLPPIFWGVRVHPAKNLRRLFDHLVGASEQRKREGCQVESPYAGSGNEGVIPALRL